MSPVPARSSRWPASDSLITPVSVRLAPLLTWICPPPLPRVTGLLELAVKPVYSSVPAVTGPAVVSDRVRAPVPRNAMSATDKLAPLSTFRLAVLPVLVSVKVLAWPVTWNPWPAAPLARRRLLVSVAKNARLISIGAAVSLTSREVPPPIQLFSPLMLMPAPALTRCSVALVAPVKSSVPLMFVADESIASLLMK